MAQSCLYYRRPGFDPWVEKIPWRRKWQPTPVLLPGESHGWRSLVGYSPWGRKESDTTERLNLGSWGLPHGSAVKNMPAMQEIQVPSLGREDPLEEEMATHSSILAWRILWSEEPGGLQSKVSEHKHIRKLVIK